MIHRLLIVLAAASVVLASCGIFGTNPPPTYAVTYDGNGNEGGAVPVDDGEYEEGDAVTVLGNTGSLTKAGVLFNGWNTAPDASGTVRTPGTSFPIGGANELLYAKWSPFGFIATAAAEANPWRSVTWGNGLCVAVAATGPNRVMYAPWAP